MYKKLGEVAEKTGWEVVVSWEQNIPFPYTDLGEVENYAKHETSDMEHLNEEERKAVFEHYLEKMRKEFNEKRALTMPAELYVLRKK